MNVFQTHASIIADYATYIRSFLNIADPAIFKVVEEELNKGKLWPEPLLQFNPSLKTHPVAVWLENRVALEERDEHLVRRTPQCISDIVAALAQESGVAEDVCRQFLADLLQWTSAVNQRLQDAGQRYTILPFKLHQFISQTGSVYTTLDRTSSASSR
jgi:hypothetical protein